MTPSPILLAARHPEAFRAGLLMPTGRGEVCFGEAMADFQRRDFAILDPAFMALRDHRQPECGRFWLERTKGASKDTDLAVMLLWLLTFSARSLACQVGAADADQADELRKAAKGIVRANPWLGDAVDVQERRIVNKRTESVCDIIPADVGGSHGARPDLLILNELSHVSKREFAENLLDNASKVPHGVVVTATNAGHLNTWQWDWRENARTSPRWRFMQHAEPAPWLDASEIEEAQRRNPPSRFSRLWRGVWSSGAGDALEETSLQAALTQQGPMERAEQGYAFVAGLDLGLSRDASALVILGKHLGFVESRPAAPRMRDRLTESLLELGFLDPAPDEDTELVHPATGRVRLAHVQVWRPQGQKLDLALIERSLLEAHGRFGFAAVAYDPWQAAYLAQRLQKAGLPMLAVDPTPGALKGQATAVIEAFSERQLDLYADAELLADLRGLRVVEKSYGMRLESPRGPSGHGDAASAFALALQLAGRVAAYPGRVEGPLLVA